jgi:hypothetical protein
MVLQDSQEASVHTHYSLVSAQPQTMSKPRGPFRPASQYPADPYAQSSSQRTSLAASERSSRAHRRAPWSLDLDALDTLSEPQKSAILILGGSYRQHLSLAPLT